MRCTLILLATVLFGTESVFAADLTSGAPGSCRGQVLLTCGKDCQLADNGPADLNLDVKAKSGEFCRGETCTPGKLSVTNRKGQWDNRPYQYFSLSDSSGVLASGVIDVRSGTFFALTSDIGTLFGRCQ